MQTYRMPNSHSNESIINKALLGSLLLHALFILLKFEDHAPKQVVRTDAVKMELISFKEAIKKSISARAETKKILQKVVKKQIDAGTLKKVVESQVLGNPTTTKSKSVQKGDPASKNFTAYEPNTDFQKMKATNIGTGGNSAFNKGLTTSNGGSGNTYKGMDFAVKSFTSSPLGKRLGIKKYDDGGSGLRSGSGVGNNAGNGIGDGTITGTTSGTLQKASILTNVGSLTGSTVGVIDSSKGAEGLSRKGTVAVANVPEDTVILGNMDPDVIRKILMGHLAQFRYCYQSELERTNSDKINGLLNLNFEIGPMGDPGQVQVNGASAINSHVKGCVAGVLRGISFPAPRGGGTVEVRQPINFYPKYN